MQQYVIPAFGHTMPNGFVGLQQPIRQQPIRWQQPIIRRILQQQPIQNSYQHKKPNHNFQYFDEKNFPYLTRPVQDMNATLRDLDKYFTTGIYEAEKNIGLYATLGNIIELVNIKHSKLKQMQLKFQNFVHKFRPKQQLNKNIIDHISQKWYPEYRKFYMLLFTSNTKQHVQETLQKTDTLFDELLRMCIEHRRQLGGLYCVKINNKTNKKKINKTNKIKNINKTTKPLSKIRNITSN